MQTSIPSVRGYPSQSSIRRALAESISGRHTLPNAWPVVGYTQRMMRHIEREDLGGLLYHQWSTVESPTILPDEASRAVTRLGQAAQALDMSRTRELHRLFDGLEAARVPTLLLKGAALAYWLYPSSFARPRCDTDLLVLDEHRRQCETLLATLGYKRARALPGENVLRQSLWEYQDKHLIHRIDLHYRLSNRHLFDSVLDEVEFMNNAQPLSKLHSHARRPHLVDAAIHAIVHRVAHHNNDPRLVWLYDIHLLLEHATDKQLEQLRERLQNHGLTDISQHCLHQCRSLFGTVDLKLTAKPGVRQVSTRLLRPQKNTALMWMDLVHARDWRTRMAYLREGLWPTRQYLHTRFPEAQHMPLIILQVRRWLSRN